MKSNNLTESNFWELYAKMDNVDALDFVGFSGSGIFNTNKQVKKLAHLFYSLKTKNSDLSKEEAYQLLFGKPGYNRQILNNYLSDLKHLLTQYLQLKWLNQNMAIQQYAMASTYLKMGLLNQFEKTIEKPDQQDTGMFNDDFYFRFKTQQLWDEYQATQIKKRKYDLLEPVLGELNVYYLIETTRMYCELMNRSNLRSQPFDKNKMVIFLSYLENITHQKAIHPLLEIYYHILTFLQQPEDENAYLNYKKSISQHVYHFALQTAREVCLYGQNQCIAQINKNKHNYLQELLDLYNLMLKANIMYEGPYMTQYTFKNYVTVALRLKAFDAATAFVMNYNSKLHPDQQFNAYHYNLAAIYFEQNNMAKAMVELNTVQLNDPIYYLDSRCILLKIYFQQGDNEALASLYHAVRVYLLRLKKITKKQADLYKYLFLFTYKLSRIKMSIPYTHDEIIQSKLSQLRNKISTADIANKSWLLSMVDASNLK